jgi:hypothetical protein
LESNNDKAKSKAAFIFTLFVGSSLKKYHQSTKQKL